MSKRSIAASPEYLCDRAGRSILIAARSWNEWLSKLAQAEKRFQRQQKDTQAIRASRLPLPRMPGESFSGQFRQPKSDGTDGLDTLPQKATEALELRTLKRDECRIALEVLTESLVNAAISRGLVVKPLITFRETWQTDTFEPARLLIAELMAKVSVEVRDKEHTLNKPAPPHEDNPATIALTPPEQAIFDFLTHDGQLGPDIVSALARQGIKGIDESALSRACNRPCMQARGVRNRPGAGYYRIMPPMQSTNN